MEDILLIEYLKKKGILNDHEYTELTSKSKHIKEEHSHSSDSNKPDKYSEFFNSFKEVTKTMNPSEKGQFVDRLKDYDNKNVEHFNESYAQYIVSNMWHMDDNGNKYSGEKYSMLKAKEICERYRGIINSSVTPSDIYIAVNEHYHRYHCLFKRWFGNDIDYQIIDSAIIYWFKDECYGPNKLWNYFNSK